MAKTRRGEEVRREGTHLGPCFVTVRSRHSTPCTEQRGTETGFNKLSHSSFAFFPPPSSNFGVGGRSEEKEEARDWAKRKSADSSVVVVGVAGVGGASVGGEEIGLARLGGRPSSRSRSIGPVARSLPLPFFADVVVFGGGGVGAGGLKKADSFICPPFFVVVEQELARPPFVEVDLPFVLIFVDEASAADLACGLEVDGPAREVVVEVEVEGAEVDKVGDEGGESVKSIGSSFVDERSILKLGPACLFSSKGLFPSFPPLALPLPFSAPFDAEGTPK